MCKSILIYFQLFNTFGYRSLKNSENSLHMVNFLVMEQIDSIFWFDTLVSTKNQGLA